MNVSDAAIGETLDGSPGTSLGIIVHDNDPGGGPHTRRLGAQRLDHRGQQLWPTICCHCDDDSRTAGESLIHVISPPLVDAFRLARLNQSERSPIAACGYSMIYRSRALRNTAPYAGSVITSIIRRTSGYYRRGEFTIYVSVIRPRRRNL